MRRVVCGIVFLAALETGSIDSTSKGKFQIYDQTSPDNVDISKTRNISRKCLGGKPQERPCFFTRKVKAKAGYYKQKHKRSSFSGLANSQQLKGNQEDPCQTKARVVGDATYCDRYWECVNGQPELYDCPNGLVYAGKNRGVTEGCDYPWRSDYCDGKQQANPPIGTDHCDWLYGIFGHETSCTRYWTCWNGTATEQLCIGGLLYNERTHSCDWPENVDGCQKHPLCNDDPNGNVPLGKSCNRYWQCQGGYPRLQRCPAMLVFDRRSLRCVVPPTEDCDVPSTLPPPIQEDDLQENIPQNNPKNRVDGPNFNNLPPGAIPIPAKNKPRN